MGLVKDEAIILSTRLFGESDKIVRFFTLSSGKVSGIAKGAKKSQKRFMNTLEPFSQVLIEYFEKPTSNLVRIENADLRESNGGLELNLKRICAASFFTEFVDKLTKEKQRNGQLFQTLKRIIDSLKTVEFTVTDVLYYQLQMLRHLGYMLNLSACVHCGKTLSDGEKLYFSKERGGTLCTGCARSVPHRQYPQGFIPRMLHLTETGMDSSFPAEAAAGYPRAGVPVFDRMGREVLEDFVKFHLAVEFKSYRLLRSVITG
ncbi:MAG TPA: DNA repair protein RecO [Syntrophorhabdales bacterium]|nr:DNA repair protein RecO [Syntrophorhabdales bacterium]